ncbi:MAG TPA: T9SS type A sorting domain-containing protein [Ignavibacteriaceae bacterium]|nr:T9SS type A sorting domain-containing protein [Ignavibacteriaceae bacterium]
MSKLYSVLCTALLLMIFTTVIIAQSGNFSNSRAPLSKQRSTIHHFDNQTQSVGSGDMAFGWSCISLNILNIPLPDGTPFTTLNTWAPPFGDFASSAVRGGDGNYYIVCMGPPSSLWQMDPITGAVTDIGPITGLESETVNGITYDPVNGTYYLAAGNYMVTNNLYSFNVNTLNASLIASFPNPGGIMIDIAINSSGVGYGYDLTDDNAYTFDPETGITTLLGPLGFDCNYGQGMDIDLATNTIYLSAFNNTTFTGQLRTMNPNTGETSLIVDWGSEQIAPFAINNNYVVPGPGPASDPDPANEATNININAQLSWTNPAGASSINVLFGTSPAGMTSIYSGLPVTTVNPGTMSYYSHYYWRVDETDGSGTTTGSLWSFKTTAGPNVPLFDPFDNMDNWTAAGPFGIENWILSNSNYAGGTAPELQFTWYPDFTGASYLLSDPITVTTGHNIELTFTNSVAEIWELGSIIGAAITTDGGVTYTSIYETSPNGAYGPEVETLNFTGTDGMQLAFYFNGNSYNFTTWAIDDVLLTDLDYVPVELISFNVSVIGGNVILNWTTATETNNRGFDVQRSFRKNSFGEVGSQSEELLSEMSDWEKIGFVAGAGTNTEPRSYSFTDENVANGTFSYRLKQIDFDGSVNYSNIIEVIINTPDQFSLSQNYPNPFNPSTEIRFSLAEKSKVVLKIYNSLGQEITTLVNGTLDTGSHNVSFMVPNIASGIYFYTLHAEGNNGRIFESTKKMILLR